MQPETSNIPRPEGVLGLDETVDALESFVDEIMCGRRVRKALTDDVLVSAHWWLLELKQRGLKLMGEEG